MPNRFTGWLKETVQLNGIRSIALLFGLYCLLVFVLYFRASGALLIDDGIEGLTEFEKMGWGGFAQSFKFTSLYYFHDLFVLLCYFVVGKSSFGWFVIMAVFHAANAVLNFVVFRKLYLLSGITHAGVIALLGSLLFLLSPYQTENVVWAATLHYSIALSAFLAGAWFLLKALSAGRISVQTILLLNGLLVVSLLTLEISLVFPFAWVCLMAPVILLKKTKVTIGGVLTRCLFPWLAAIALYFIATRLIKGHWIPHYGATHLTNNTLQNFSTSVARYVVKLLAYVHFANYHHREVVYEFCNRWKVVLAIQGVLAAGVFFLLRVTKGKPAAFVFLGLTAASMILLFPSLQMYFMYLFTPENDRLSYFFSVGLYQLIPLVLLHISFVAGILVSLAYSAAGIWLLELQVSKWHEAALVHKRCIDSFVWSGAPRVYTLNEPSNYKGAYVLRNKRRLPSALFFFKKIENREQIVPVMASAYSGLSDSTVVTIENDSTLRVSLITNGGWLMHEGMGAVDYSTDNFTVDVDEWSPSYRVVFHHKEPGAVFIYSSGSGFYKVEGF